jgi:hypothetical protein
MAMKDESHHDLMCSNCRGITEIGEKSLGWLQRKRNCPADFWWNGMQ